MRSSFLAFVIIATVVAAACGKKSRTAASVDAGPKPIERPARKGRTLPPLPDPLPGVRKPAGALIGEGALRGAAGDLDGDGTPELVVAGAKELRVATLDGKVLATAPSPGGPQVLGVAGGAIFTGWGSSRDHQEAPARVALYRLKGNKLEEEVIMTPATSRQEILSIVPIPREGSIAPDFLVAYFENKYMVQAGTVTRNVQGSWVPTQLANIRMATSWARGDVDGDGIPDIVVARVYGDDKEADGDAFILRPDGTRTPIPTTRGARSLLLADTDGAPEIWLGDGWHRDYGKIARGLLSVARPGKSGWETEVIEDTEGQSSLNRLLAADVDGDDDLELVTVGSDYVRVFKREDRWRGLTVAGKASDVIVADVDADGADELIILPDPFATTGAPPAVAEIISLKDTRWP